MSWQVIARKEVKDALRSRVLHALSGMLVLFALALTGLYASLPSMFGVPAAELTLESFISTIGSAAVLVPIIGGMLGYKAIAGERTSGSLALMLSQPHTREDVVLGKFAGRTVVLAVPVLLAFAAGLGVAVISFDAYSLVDYATFLALLVLIGTVYVSVAIGFSASTRSPTRAAVGVVGYYVVFNVLWNGLVRLFDVVSNRITEGEWVIQLGGYPDWAYWLLLLSPHNAYQIAMRWFVFDGGPQAGAQLPDFVNGWTALIVLVLWIVVPLTIGVRRFDAVDL